MPIAAEETGSVLHRMSSNVPSNKVTGAALAAAIVQVLVWFNNSRGGPAIPVEVAGALTVLISFVVGYVVPPGPKENIIEVVRAPAADAGVAPAVEGSRKPTAV